MTSEWDIIFVGGGLSGSLAAYRLKSTFPALKVAVVETNSSLGGQHTWSYHPTDLPIETREWMTDFHTYAWDSHKVRFPKFEKQLRSGYRTLVSQTLHDKVSPVLSGSLFLNNSALEIGPQQVVLQDQTLQAPLVLRSQGWPSDSSIPIGFQKFFGLEVELHEPHSLDGPILMDATVPQVDGFRFMYTLPFGPKLCLIEDTYYSDNPRLNFQDLEQECLRYASNQGWKVHRIRRKEKGCLPLPLGGQPPLANGAIGMASGLFHATTGYSLPWAVETAELITRLWPTGPRAVLSGLESWSMSHWKQQNYYRLLNRLLFKASTPEKRYKVLEKFYGHNEDLILRFYAGRSTLWDRTKIFSGRPPVPLTKAVQTIARGLYT